MTEQEWLTCTDPAKMLDFLRTRSSNRKARLFAVACCRQGWHWLTNSYLRLAVEAAESYADGRITEDDLTKARAAAWSVSANRGTHATAAARAAVRESSWAAAREVQREMIHQVWKKPSWLMAPEEKEEKNTDHRQQCDLIRCIFGNPFRIASVNPNWLVWNGGVIPKLTQAIYDDRAFDHLPILADALEEAGCTNADILNHCRQPGEHVRGCWVVDLLLGKS
jgi:hypothetical protein